ncbi:MAG: hypothetical protein MJZ08_07825 [Bacteroidaceae bacterium]|nr:hypothetical protein [Bacteroidaceae bacterium]
MKKTYIKPITKTVNVRIESHIAALSGGGDDTVSVSLNASDEGEGGADVLSKEDFGW